MNTTKIALWILSASLLPSIASAQWQGPNPLKDTWLGIPFWEHPKGDTAQLPCTHLKQQHPGGHPGPMLPCTHLEAQHSSGDFTGTTAPCTHIKNFKQEHPAGHKVYGPCVHIAPKHPDGHSSATVACAHMVPEHAAGHTGPNLPCVHILPVKKKVNSLGLWFYTDDANFQAEAIQAVQKLNQLGVNVGSPRPLHLFYRPPANGVFSVDDPLWSHYNSGFHSIQVLKGSGDGWKSTLHHELGHSTLGHSCVQIIGGGKHSLTSESKPGTAMSEGWGTFVALAIENDVSTARPIWRSLDYENAKKSDGTKLSKYSPNIEFLVTCFLWDLYDQNADGVDSVKVSFTELFRVFSPSLKTLSNGPIIPNLADFVSRFGKNNPQLALAASNVATQNTSDPDGKSAAKSSRTGSTGGSKRRPAPRKKVGGG